MWAVVVSSSPGAGDLFASGFLYGMLRGLGVRKSAQIGCLAGGAIVQTVGAEMSPANWQWLFARYCLRTLQQHVFSYLRISCELLTAGAK